MCLGRAIRSSAAVIIIGDSSVSRKKASCFCLERIGIIYRYLQFNAYRIYEEVLAVNSINHIESASEFSHAE